MNWGKSCDLAWLAALAVAYLLAVCPAVTSAQNNAESQPPKPAGGQKQDETNTAEKQPQKDVAGNVAEKSPTKKDDAEKGGKEEPTNPFKPKKEETKAKPKDSEPVKPVDAGSKDKSDSPKLDSSGKENAGKPEGLYHPPTLGHKEAPDGPGQVAETSTSKPGDSDETKDANTAQGDATTAPDGNIAEAESATPDTPGESTAPPPASFQPPIIPQANTAENRPTATTAQNTAEAGEDDESEVAEPPVPHFSLPTPAEAAGSLEGYIAPSIDLLDSPALENAPDRLDTDAFFQPTRSYLDRRPLPDIDIEETSEEELARSFEESLKLINLAQENRTESGIKVPLPSGVMTFKASDAFEFDRRNKILKFVGNAELVFDNIAIWADLIEVDDGAATAYAKGYVGIQEKDEILFCDEAYLNYDTKTLELFWVEGNTGGPKIEGAVFFEAERAYGSFDKLEMENVKVTTCEPYCGGPTEMHMQAEKMRYQRDKSIVLINTYLYARGQKYFYIPMLAFPLDRTQPIKQGESDLEQNYGYQRSQGWFAQFAYTYSVRYAENVNRALLGVARIELSEKLGPGLGLRQDYLIPSLGVATVKGFYQGGWPDTPLQRFFFHPLGNAPYVGYLSRDDFKSANDKQPANFKFSLDQELLLSRTLTGSLKVSRDDTITPARTEFGNDRRNNSWNNNLNLNYKKNNTSASINGRQTITITGGFTNADNTQEPSSETTSSSGAIRFNTKFSKDIKFNFLQDYSSNKGGSGRQNLPADQEGSLDMRVEWAGKRDTELEGYSAKLGYKERGIDYDQDNYTKDSTLQIRKELPSLEIRLPRDVFNDGAYFNNFTINIDNLVTGRRRNPESTFRGKLTASGQDSVKFSPSSTMNTNVTAEQYWYDDGNAQYALRPRISYNFNPKSWWAMGASWNMLYRKGVELPPDSEKKNYSNRGNINFTMSNYRSWRWKLSSGYDFDNHSSYPVSSTFNWDPNRTFGLTQTMTYNLREHTFNPSRLTSYVRSPYVDENGYYNWLLKITWDHDLKHHGRTTRLDLRWLKRWGDGWTTDVQGGYRDGSGVPPPPRGISTYFAKDFLKRITVRKTNCCTTVEGSWRAGNNEFQLNVYLNALPQYPYEVENFKNKLGQREADVFFPTTNLQQDILREQFGITQRLF